MSAPNRYQLDLLGKAVAHLRQEEFAPYLRLKHLLSERPSGFQVEFRRTFANYYGLQHGGLADAFKDRYFELLFELKLQDVADPYTPILKELYEIPRRLGDKALQCSFVSKLVAVHDESRPIYDRHVSNFFGIVVPPVGDVDFRIAGFLTNLHWLRETYQRWSQDSQFQGILQSVQQKHPALQDCAMTRLADFLVWTVGRKKLWKYPGRR